MAQIQHVTFNFDFSCFVSCGKDGVRVFSVDPLSQLHHIKMSQLDSGTGAFVVTAELIKKSSLIAIICSNEEQCVKIWDCARNVIRRQIRFSRKVLKVRFHQKRLIVILTSQIFFFSIKPDIIQLSSYKTRENPLGLIAANDGHLNQIVAFPGLNKPGSVQITDLDHTGHCCMIPPVFIQAHQSELACITLNIDGMRLATASKQGTLIRLFDTVSGEKLVEFRRGSDLAVVYCLNFSRDSTLLCAASDKGTVHIFSVANTNLNKHSVFKAVGSLISSWTESQWSAAKFTVPAEMACVCSFLPSQPSSVVAICVDGSYHKYLFKLDGKTNRETYDRFLDLGDSQEM